MMKNAFYFMLNALFVLEIFTWHLQFPDIFVEKPFDKKDNL